MTRTVAPMSARILAALAGVFAIASHPSHAESGWFEPGDQQLRTDLQLLNDAEVIRYPVNQWPIPRAALQFALDEAKPHQATNSAVQAALERLRARLAPRQGRLAFHAGVRGGQAAIVRDFDTPAREDAEAGGGLEFVQGSFSMGLNATLVADPDDGQEIRADGSHATLQLGNWLLSANTLDRWWGPGHESSLILSSNARPMPTAMIERAISKPFENKWLNWLGPWRFSFGISRMEGHRVDVDSPLFMAWRVAVMPFKDVEIGFSRTAQFCGHGSPCDGKAFWDLLIGNDNPGFDATPESEPGNQMAGFDLRWASPIGDGPYAVYAQYIGEDESSYLPAKYLGQLGFEVWKPFARGDILLMFAEYSNTTCSGLSGGGPYYDCAYNQGRYDVEGYRYRGRVIGHTADSDAETYAIGATYTRIDGSVWSATLRAAQFNRDGFDPRNTVSAGPADYAALELGWRGQLFGESVFAELGVEALDPVGAGRDVEPYGFIGWHHDFEP